MIFQTSEKFIIHGLRQILILIEALAEQGNPAVFELIDAVEKEVFKEKKKDKIILDTKIIVKLKLATAFCLYG